jgi:hypothetical protein
MDPSGCEEFLVAALEIGIKIKSIRHEGVNPGISEAGSWD